MATALLSHPGGVVRMPDTAFTRLAMLDGPSLTGWALKISGSADSLARKKG